MSLFVKLKSILRNPVRTVLLHFHHKKNISFRPSASKKQIIICFDGFSKHGGLVDRLKAMISFYEASKLTGFEFKIYHKFPFMLEELLEPNQYNWIATEEDMKWNPFKTRFLYVMLDFKFNPLKFFSNTSKNKIFVYNEIDYLEKILPELNKEQLKERWSETFNYLFKKSAFLNEKIEELHLVENRVAIHSRFTSILGDFVDVDVKVIPKEEQVQLFKDLEKKIKEVAAQLAVKNVYIFSDSIIYLNYMKENTDFIILEGKPLHPENVGHVFTLEEHAKSFLDFFAIAESKEIFLIRKDFMYPSAYPRYASYLHNVKFTDIVID